MEEEEGIVNYFETSKPGDYVWLLEDNLKVLVKLIIRTDSLAYVCLPDGSYKYTSVDNLFDKHWFEPDDYDSDETIDYPERQVTLDPRRDQYNSLREITVSYNLDDRYRVLVDLPGCGEVVVLDPDYTEEYINGGEYYCQLISREHIADPSLPQLTKAEVEERLGYKFVLKEQ